MVQYCGQLRSEGRIVQAAHRDCADMWPRAIVHSEANPRGIEPGSPDQAVWLVRVVMKCKRPTLRYGVVACRETTIGPESRQPRPGEIDNPQILCDLHPREAAQSELTECDDSEIKVTTERLDERARGIDASIEGAEFAGRSVESVTISRVEILWCVSEEVDSRPYS